MIKKISAAVFCFTFLCMTVNADNGNKTTIKLKNVLSQITSVKTDLTQKKRQQTSVKQQLENLKKKIEALVKDSRKTTKSCELKKSALIKLTKDRTRQQLKLKEAQNKLSSQINLAYQIERSDYFKIVLDKEKKITSDMLLVYHGYVFAARFEQMHHIKKALENLEQNKRKIQLETRELEKLEKKQGQQKLELEATKKEHNQILGSLQNRITEQNKKLKLLLLAKRNLENLVNTLTPRRLAIMSPKLKARFCRDFVWPTKGTITTHFGSPIEQSSWKWNGVVINASLNQEIRAISSGKVIYADWLTGYGLLLIIDHGSGYMSLYGHNNSFRRQLNTMVKAGEVVATVGKSGSEEPKLYFAIRYNGKPIDPERWCR